MAGGLDLSCLYSTVKNTSGYQRTFGFLPPHGRKLAVGEEFTVFGDIREALVRFERTSARQNMLAFEGSLRRGSLTIISTPSPIIEDDADPGASYMLYIHNGSLGVKDPCWEGSVSDPAEFGG